VNAPAELTQQELKLLLANLDKMPKAEQKRLLDVVEELETRKKAEKSRTSLLDFAKLMMPEYKIGRHHKKLAGLLEDMAHGRKSRVTVSSHRVWVNLN